jgi:hypothetical protein
MPLFHKALSSFFAFLSIRAERGHRYTFKDLSKLQAYRFGIWDLIACRVRSCQEPVDDLQPMADNHHTGRILLTVASLAHCFVSALRHSSMGPDWTGGRLLGMTILP